MYLEFSIPQETKTDWGIFGRPQKRKIVNHSVTNLFLEHMFQGAKCSSLRLLYVTISTTKINFFLLIYYVIIMKVSLRRKKLGVAIWNFFHFVTLTVIVRPRFLFFASFSNLCHKITVSQMLSLSRFYSLVYTYRQSFYIYI